MRKNRDIPIPNGDLNSQSSVSLASNERLREFTDLTAYPFLTEEVSRFSTTPGQIGSGAEGTAPLGRIVEGALRDVLGWRPNARRPKEFVAALTQTFTAKTVDDQEIWEWTPRSYAIQSDIGAVTGAQASIYTRAKVARDQSIPLLEGLSPLRSDADEEDTSAIRAIVRFEIDELVNELGVEGGPRVQRINSLFESLLGSNTVTNPELVGGQLGQLRKAFGLKRNKVNTIEEEQNLTNFLIIVDYITALKQSWAAQQTYFDRVGTDVFLGTQLVLVSRALAVVAESVQEVYFAMDSVFLGAAERQTIELIFKAEDESPLFVGELLDWIYYFATEKGPHLIREGGKAGVRALQGTAKRLSDLVRQAIVTSYGGAQDPGGLPAGYGTGRVQRALAELVDYLDEVTELIGQFD
ncbi:MAG: hypothetical protein KDJ52_04620 [Anaerolineae bacterium]|nr:hypothetical protein [Anaerolineae bacterium]